MAPNVENYRYQIKKQLLEQFNEADLHALILDLGIELELYPHNATKGQLIEAVVGYMARNGQLERLITTLKKQRNDLIWPPVPSPAQQMADERVATSKSTQEILPPPELGYTLVFWFILLGLVVAIILFFIYYNAISSLN